MLKKFFLNFLSSFVGAWVALGLFCVVAVIVVISIFGKIGMSQMQQGNTIGKNSVMVIELSGDIEERETPTELDYIQMLQGNLDAPMTLSSLTSSIREAADSKDVKMIYLKCKNLSAGMATLRALRNELQEFKKNGKKIYAYGDSYGLADYYLASVADSLFVNPDGVIAVKGISGGMLYYKDLLDKLGIQVQVVKVGTFKSAVEPYISNEMSQPARAQLDTLYANIWNQMVSEICSDRKIKSADLNNLINKQFPQLQDGNFAVRNHLADKAVYERSMDGRVADALGIDKDDINYVDYLTVSASKVDLNVGKKKRIAVLYATGEIMEGSKTGINCEVLVPLITGLADDDDVMGMVLRVNSPGGSVFGSEQIADALAYFQSKNKPLAVSMGDYAASGGYWISCHADKIFADPMTITGSIGIFGMIPNLAGVAKKVGVTPQFISTNPDANFPSLLKPMTEVQLQAMQSMIERGYDKFITRVATGRKMSKAKVEAIAEGRVWDGETALKLGLVDELGSLADACEWVKSKADKDGKDLKLEYLPSVEPSFWDLVRISSLNEGRIALIKEVAKFVPESEHAVEVANIIRRKPVQARIVPFTHRYVSQYE